MSAAVTLNQSVTLVSSDNIYLKYPVKGVIEIAEIGVDGKPIWATFRAQREGSIAPPVVIRNYLAEPL